MRAISSAAATESADDAADSVSDAAVTSVESVANAAPVSSDTNAVSAASTAATANAVRLKEAREDLARPPEAGKTLLPLSLITAPVITPRRRVRHGWA
ncbi:hypothetical protein [Streptomyces sp. NPDC002088]|uniref:hypothetical protein n=1 Tax=Streptomyces sp. NPDC002088 TaxID=3154665 RepID=UPI00332643D3